MGQIGNTDFINATTGGTALISDTFVQLDDGATNNSTDTTAPLNAYTEADETGAIFNVKVPERNEVLDTNGNAIPADAVFSSLQFQIYRTAAPSGGAFVYGYLLKDELNLEVVTHNTTDGSTAWEPLFATTTGGRAIYQSLIIPNIVVSDATGAFAFTVLNLIENDITWGSKFQFIMYSGTDMTIGMMNHGTAAYKPDIKIFFDKPVPPAPLIQVVPDDGGINGIIKITPSSDDAVVQNSVAWTSEVTTVTQTLNTTDFTDKNREAILTSELTKDAACTVYAVAGGSGLSYNIYPLAFDSGKSIDTTGNSTGDIPFATRFKLFAEDNYNTNANGSPSAQVDIARPSVTLTDDAGTIAIGDTVTYTLSTSKNATTGAGLGNYDGAFQEYAFVPDIHDIVSDSGTTVTSGLSSGTTQTYFVVSNRHAFDNGSLIKIEDEYLRVVGQYDSGASQLLSVTRGELGSTAATHANSTAISGVDDSQFIFHKLDRPVSHHTFTYKYPHAKDTHKAVAYVKDQDGWRSDPKHVNVQVSEADPIAKLSASRTKVPYALYGDNAAGLTLSLSNSKAIGSDRELTQYLFTYNVGKRAASATEPQPVATCNALTNDNSCFDTGSKRVALVNCGSNENYADTTFKIFGLASFQSDGTTAILDTTTASFSHYKYVTETLTVNASRLVETVSVNYYKSIDCVVGQEIDEHDRENARFVIKVANSDVETNVVNELDGAVGSATSTTITVDAGSAYNVGDFVLCESEIMLVTAISTDDLTVIRGMFFSTAATHDDEDAVKVINHNMWINRDLHVLGEENNTFTSNTGLQWKWGGFAMVRGDSTGDGIDFETDEEIELQTVNKSYSTYGSGGSPTSNYEEDWYALGFLEGDVIKVGNTTDNGTYVVPKYFKIIKIFHDDHGTAGVYDKIKVAADTDLLTDDEALYVSIALAAETDTNADIVRFDNALDPTRTVALTSYNATTATYTGEADDFIFHGAVVDNDDGSGWLHRDTKTQIRVRGVGVRTLDLDSLVSSGDIAVLGANISRSGGVSAKMPLGDRRYPIGGLNTKLGNVEMSINLRILSQAGLRQVWSLIEGDRYDYFFLDSKQVDAPATAYKSYRMKLMNGTVDKAPEHAAQYLASIKAVVVGEEIS